MMRDDRKPETRPHRATIIDVARAAGVSKSTVSLVLSGSDLVADATRDKVSAAMQALGYIYHRGAATLRGARSSIIGMVINNLANPFFVEMAIGIEEAGQNGAFIPFLANSAENPARQAQMIRSMREHGAAGLILSPAIGSVAADVAPLIAGLPVVLAMRRLPGLKASLVVPDNRDGAFQATRHLIALGHRKIAFVGGRRMVVRDERLAGYHDALAAAGLPRDTTLECETAADSSGGEIAARHCIGRVTAALCFNDAVAIGLIRALAQHGVQAGRDFAVIGFDDIDEARHMLPALTTVSVGGRALGDAAAQVLIRQMAGAAAPESLILPTRLVIRASCGAALGVQA